MSTSLLSFTICRKCKKERKSEWIVHQIQRDGRNCQVYHAQFQPTSGYLKHVFVVFERLGYQTVTSHVSNWDVLWCHDYPFMQLKDEMMNLKIHQRVRCLVFAGQPMLCNPISDLES